MTVVEYPNTSGSKETHTHRTPCECGTNAYLDDGEEIGSLGEGGSYDICKCSNCGKRVYVAVAD